ncbi:MAG TPA: hypothetical protein VJ625_04590 [Propionibacteriaceae bacterium]|nr:hypothetical protein [Propionibacteriaceae bacterium]
MAETATGVQSPLEFRWIKQVERPHRLPTPTRPYQLPSGGVADGGYEEFRVLLELDGRRAGMTPLWSRASPPEICFEYYADVAIPAS